MKIHGKIVDVPTWPEFIINRQTLDIKRYLQNTELQKMLQKMQLHIIIITSQNNIWLPNIQYKNKSYIKIRKPAPCIMNVFHSTLGHCFTETGLDKSSILNIFSIRRLFRRILLEHYSDQILTIVVNSMQHEIWMRKYTNTCQINAL